MIGEPSREYAWVLSRNPNVSVEQMLTFEQKFREQGYDTCKILISIQDGGFADRQALCQLK